MVQLGSQLLEQLGSSKIPKDLQIWGEDHGEWWPWPLGGPEHWGIQWLGGWPDAWIDQAEVIVAGTGVFYDGSGWPEFWEEWCFQQHAQRWLDPQ